MDPVKKGASATLNIPFKNIGNKPLLIIRTQGSGIPSVSSSKDPIFPDGSGIIEFRMPTNFTGTTKQDIFVNTNIDDKVIVLKITLTIYDDEKRQVYGTIKNSIGEPLPGAIVAVENNIYRATEANIDGKYSIIVTPNEFLVFRFAGMKEKKIKASELQINVALENDIILEGVYGPPDIPKRKVAEAAFATHFVNAKDIKNAKNPKYNFKRDHASNVYVVYITDSLPLEKKDIEFQEKYKVVYTPYVDHSFNYRQRYNKLVFKYLSKKFKKGWELEIRKDAIGLSDSLK